MTEAMTSKDVMAEDRRAGAVLPGHVEAKRDRWQQRALLAEGKLAELSLMLTEYRFKGRPMPTYSELARLLLAGKPGKPPKVALGHL